MKLHNPFKLAEEAESPLLMICIIVSICFLLIIFLLFTGPYSVFIFPVAGITRIVYAVFKGK